MTDDTRAVFLAWRAEIEAEIVAAEDKLATSRAALNAALEAVKCESVRIGALNATLSRLRPKVDLANSLRVRMAKAVQPSPATSSRGHAERVTELEFAIADMRQALAQIDMILWEPEPVASIPDARPAPVPLVAYDPIVMPARISA